MLRFLLHIKTKLSALIHLLTIPFLLYFHPSDDMEMWSKISIEEVFVSKKTHEIFRDENSPAEFGWHISDGTVFMGRSSLYSTFYIPVKPYNLISLTLVERDIFSDDIVASVKLKKFKKKYKLNNENDFVILKWDKFFPDGSSGSDFNSSGASELKEQISDSVDFQKGDYTDYYKVKNEKTIVFIQSEKSGLNITSPGNSGCSMFPSVKLNKKFFLLNCSGLNNFIRIRSPVGSNRMKYSLYTAEGDASKIKMTRSIMNYINNLSADDPFDMQDLADILLKTMPEEAKSFCSNNAKKSTTQNIFCNQYISGNDF